MPKRDPGVGAKPSKGGDNLPPLEFATSEPQRTVASEPALSTPILYDLDMSQRAATHLQKSTIARTIRIPVALSKRIASDAERCGRSFEGQVIALLRRHYGEDVNIAPRRDRILALAVASLASRYSSFGT